MTLNEYQTNALETAGELHEIRDAYLPLGLASEAGEACDVVKKVFRDNNQVWDDMQRDKLAKELGDVLWYVAVLAAAHDLPLDMIARINNEKTRSRLERDKIHGSGDDR